MEEWAPLEEFPGYEVSTEGRIRNALTYHVLGIYDNGHGVYQVVMRRDGHPTARAVHRLVALTFIGPPPEQGYVPIHLDGHAWNNRVDNLEWRSRAFAIRRTKQGRRTDPPIDPRPVRRVRTGETFRNAREAAFALNGLEEQIYGAARWPDPPRETLGSTWEFVW